MRRLLAGLALTITAVTGTVPMVGHLAPAAAAKNCVFMGNTSDRKLMYGCSDGVETWVEYL